MTTNPSQARKAATIPVIVCTASLCYAAIPAEQIEQHAAWHRQKSIVRSTK